MSYGLPMPRQVPNFLRDYGGLISIALVSLIIIVALWPNSTLRMMFWNPVAAALGISEPSPLPANPAGDYRLRGGPSVTPKQIDRILASYGSPAQGTGQIWYNLGLEYRIDPAFAVAFFIHESSAGTHPGWAGWIDRPGGQHTHNVGNIICAGYHRCHGRFRHYANWEEGIADWYRLISVEYIEGRGTETVAEIIPIYAPAFENDVAQYVGTVERLVDRWRQGNIP
jgi:hypothetical protein